jgi:hypothetical protein
MLREKDLEVSGKKYRVRQLPATRAAEIMLEVIKVGGGVTDGLTGSMKRFFDLPAGPMVKGLLDRLDPTRHTRMIVDIVQESIMAPAEIREGDTPVDEYFAGELDSLFQLFVEIMRFNFEKSWERIRKKLEALLGADLAGGLGNLKAVLESNSQSGGQSSESCSPKEDPKG